MNIQLQWLIIVNQTIQAAKNLKTPLVRKNLQLVPLVFISKDLPNSGIWNLEKRRASGHLRVRI